MDSFSYIANADVAVINDLYEQYKKDPQSVDESWQNFFKGFDFNQSYNSNGHTTTAVTDAIVRKEMEVVHLVRAYRARGHLLSNTNPIGGRKDRNPQLELADFNLSNADLDTVFEAGTEVFGRPATLREIVNHLKNVYLGKIGFEYFYIRDRKAKSWLRDKIENEYPKFKLSTTEKLRILDKLKQAVLLEEFLHKKFLGKKRFSLEGGETTIPALDMAINYAAEQSVEEVAIGMAHRGRLNVLTNILQKPYSQLFLEFNEDIKKDEGDDGDVKYHMGYSSQVNTLYNKRVSLKLMANPSHLETIDPIVLGYCRARADAHFESASIKSNDREDIYDKVLPILIHGDAAVAGQGIVYEVAQMSNLPGYYVGGTLHFVINNQVGFTTDFDDARSSIYCSDVAKIIDAPIIHVNGDDPEAVVYAMKLAVEFRQLFNRDVFIDMVCFRKYGHNEADEPRMTQPKMYQVIDVHKNVREIYLEQLLSEKVITKEEADIRQEEFVNALDSSLSQVKQLQLPYEPPKLEREWLKIRRSREDDFYASPDTGISKEEFNKVAKALTSTSEGFTLLKQIEKVIEERKKAIIDGEKPLNWAMGELMAYGSILSEGKLVRLSGQDVERGTFSHRQAVLHDAITGKKYSSLAHIGEGQGKFEVYNSLLSEYGVLGFEFGYAMANPNALVIWEAQFGDFANGAQILIDQFIATTETKWNSWNSLVLLLPHGYEGQGPEHSSARPERFLQLAARYSMYICQCTTPANFFHMMRRQLAQPFRKPCIHFSPKSMLRHPNVVSAESEFLEGTHFKEIIGDTYADPKKVNRILLCTGKVYWDLYEKQQKENLDNVAIIRIEQLYPFPEKQLNEQLAQYDKNARLLWVQEEPVNMGYWYYIVRKFPQIGLGNVVARKAASSPATGYLKVHIKQQAELIEKAYTK